MYDIDIIGMAVIKNVNFEEYNIKIFNDKEAQIFFDKYGENEELNELIALFKKGNPVNKFFSFYYKKTADDAS
jgi:hypothetical protein